MRTDQRRSTHRTRNGRDKRCHGIQDVTRNGTRWLGDGERVSEGVIDHDITRNADVDGRGLSTDACDTGKSEGNRVGGTEAGNRR